MGKRSHFKRRAQDDYQTIDARAVAALLPYIGGIRRFAEPCCGDHALVRQLCGYGLTPALVRDIRFGDDALKITDWQNADAIITNPPWTRRLLHPLIAHFIGSGLPTWLLFDADWAHNKHAAPLLPYCTDIVAVGRLIWIPGTTMTGKDNCCWYRFRKDGSGRGPLFHGRR